MGTIYCIRSKQSGKRYVGKTMLSIEKRFYKHCYDAKRGSSTYLHKAIRKYGIDNFEVYAIEQTDDISERELFWIHELNTMAPNGYNLTIGGDGGNTSNTDGYKLGMRNRRSYKGKNNPMYGKSAMRGKNHSSDTKAKMSNSRREYWANLDRIEYKCKTSGESTPMYGKVPKNAKPITINNVLYQSISEASRIIGISEYKVKKYETSDK